MLIIFALEHRFYVQMNLATRCREAISHVAILKKELSLTQQRAAHTTQQDRRG